MNKLRSVVLFVVLVLALMVGGSVGVSAQDEAPDVPDVVTVVEVIEQSNTDWQSIRELLLIVIGGVASIGGIWVLYRSSPVDFTEKALKEVETLIEKIALYQNKAELTPTKVDDLVGYLAMFGAEYLSAALERKMQEASGQPKSQNAGLDNALFG